MFMREGGGQGLKPSRADTWLGSDRWNYIILPVSTFDDDERRED